jgi:hypothetical protein
MESPPAMVKVLLGSLQEEPLTPQAKVFVVVEHGEIGMLELGDVFLQYAGQAGLFHVLSVQLARVTIPP